MLHNVRTQAQYDALPADIKAEYKKTGDDAFTLQHDADTGALTRALERERLAGETLSTKLNTVEGELDTLKSASSKTGSPAQIASEAREAALAEVKPQLERAIRLETRLKTGAVTTTAMTLAKEVGGEKNAAALLPHVERRIAVKLDENDEPVIVINDAKGQATQLKTSDLVTELRANKDLAPLVTVAVGSGGQGKQPGTLVVKQSPAGSAGETNIGTMTAEQSKAYIQSKYVDAAA